MAQAAAIYARISQDTLHNGLGVARQEADCRKLAAQLGWPVANVYVDNDISAFSGKLRPSYRRLLADLGAGAVDSLIIWHPDRLHRSPLELEEFIGLVENTGAHVQTVTSGERDLATPTGRLHARIEGAVARHESEHKSERIRRKHLELAENGAVSGGGRRPFGYESDRVTVRPDEARLIRQAVTAVLAGGSVRGIARRWKDQGVPTVTGSMWTHNTVKRILLSGRIAGQREHHGQVSADAVWPAIISPAESARLRALLNSNYRPVTAPGNSRTYLLGGFLWCGACGTRMHPRSTSTTGAKGHRTRRFACIPEKGGCSKVGIAADPLDDLIVEAVIQRLDGPALAEAVARRAGASHVTADLDQAIADDEAALEELTRDRYVGRTLTAAMFAAARGPLERRLADNRAALAASTLTATVDLPTGGVLRQRWQDLDLEQRRAVLGQVIDRIVIAPTTKANNRFDPARVGVIWKV